jgi:hypothetical protein
MLLSIRAANVHRSLSFSAPVRARLWGVRGGAVVGSTRGEYSTDVRLEIITRCPLMPARGISRVVRLPCSGPYRAVTTVHCPGPS